MFLKWHSMLFSDTCGHKFKPIKAGVYRAGGVPFKTGVKIPASEISTNLTAMCQEYEKLRAVTLQDILELHVQFENIHPFDDGNGRFGRLLMLKECLRHGITPFILDDKRRSAYLDGIRCWEKDPLPLMQVCMEAQARFQAQIELEKLLEAQTRILRRHQNQEMRTERGTFVFLRNFFNSGTILVFYQFKSSARKHCSALKRRKPLKTLGFCSA